MHNRVIPRDLFNEAKLLKCYGQLALALFDGKIAGLYMSEPGEGQPFVVEFDDANNMLTLANVVLWLGTGETEIPIGTRYNSKDPYPLAACEGAIDVFNDDGTITTEFREYVAELANREKSE